ncbi:Vacuolar protein sorting-associated protein 13B [Liparis tanakae]|uniref:Vacuolar protein sorting-associated protein 13B n=1 Tax=Liparis tanakae TaxID=230148 RepID=A0A4Z2ECK7_9TELE|nr:Vacuolar protein sorting-associated protein 13B [Liparis tanakae]
MQNFQRSWDLQSSAGSKARGVISGVGKGIVGVFTKPIGGAAELVSQTGYGILHGAGLWHLPKQLYLPTEEKSSEAPNSHLKYRRFPRSVGPRNTSERGRRPSRKAAVGSVRCKR